jgi:hypothetical protein
MVPLYSSLLSWVIGGEDVSVWPYAWVEDVFEAGFIYYLVSCDSKSVGYVGVLLTWFCSSLLSRVIGRGSCPNARALRVAYTMFHVYLLISLYYHYVCVIAALICVIVTSSFLQRSFLWVATSHPLALSIGLAFLCTELVCLLARYSHSL